MKVYTCLYILNIKKKKKDEKMNRYWRFTWSVSEKLNADIDLVRLLARPQTAVDANNDFLKLHKAGGNCKFISVKLS